MDKLLFTLENKKAAAHRQLIELYGKGIIEKANTLLIDKKQAKAVLREVVLSVADQGAAASLEEVEQRIDRAVQKECARLLSENAKSLLGIAQAEPTPVTEPETPPESEPERQKSIPDGREGEMPITAGAQTEPVKKHSGGGFGRVLWAAALLLAAGVFAAVVLRHLVF